MHPTVLKTIRNAELKNTKTVQLRNKPLMKLTRDILSPS
jgi:hypothetical protein